MLLRSCGFAVNFAKHGRKFRGVESVVNSIGKSSIGRPVLSGEMRSSPFSSLVTKSIDVGETWEQLQSDAHAVLSENGGRDSRFGLKEFVEDRILSRSSFEDSLSAMLHAELHQVSNLDYNAMVGEVLQDDTSILECVAADLDRFLVMDPAAEEGGMLKIFLFFKGFQAVQCARVAHRYWNAGDKWIASGLQSDMSDKFGVDIHPASQWGKGITMDHGTSVVVGETAVIGDNVYLMHDVTLGATGNSDDHDRHPKIGRGVFLACKSTILGNIQIGDGAVVGAQSLVNRDVPPGYTAVGTPSRLIPPKADVPKMAPSGEALPCGQFEYRCVMGKYSAKLKNIVMGKVCPQNPGPTMA
jgi:serine O-acetyltransferase